MMKALTLILILSATIIAQTYKAVNLKGEVKSQSVTEEGWIELEEGTLLSGNEIVLTGSNSSVELVNEDFRFRLNGNSAVSVASIKEMSLDELLLALAMEDLINAPKKIEDGHSDNTAVYGTENNSENFPDLESGPFGIKRLNGALQLASSGFTESAVVFAKETYRKYPDTKTIPRYRIYIANVLHQKGLYAEALREYKEIAELDLNKEQRSDVESFIGEINKILLSD
jgi:hypothetical protein